MSYRLQLEASNNDCSTKCECRVLLEYILSMVTCGASPDLLITAVADGKMLVLVLMDLGLLPERGGINSLLEVGGYRLGSCLHTRGVQVM